MAQLHINVTEDAVRTLENLSTHLHDLNKQTTDALSKLRREYEDNASGLGAHSHEILLLLEELEDMSGKANQANRKLAQKATRAAMIRAELLGKSPYRYHIPVSDSQSVIDALGETYDNLIQQGIRPKALGPLKESGNTLAYQNPYVKTTYHGEVTYTDPQTKQRVTKVSNRDVYENSNIDPAMVIPAGTKYLNGHSVKADTTNLALMKEGKAPFISVTDANSSARFVPVELHHLSAEETRHGSVYFTGSEQDGSLIEIAATVHDDYSRQLHIGGPSFRRDAENSKTADAAKYDSFRSTYWKHRAEKFLLKK